jgi:serine/threonine protein kinase
MTGLEQYVGQVLDEKYRLERLIGQGGMGAVYLATHLGTERYVALKLITPQFMSNEEFVERFKREARAAGRLRHPNVVDVTDFGFARAGTDRVAYLVMEYLDGCTLGDVLAEEKRLPLEWVVDILEQVCSAVHEAHQQGIIHRDLKPDNIWLEPNRLGGYRVKVLDFGIAKLGEAGHDALAIAAAPTAATQIPKPAADLETSTLLLASEGGDEAATQHLNATTAGGSIEADSTQLFGAPATMIKPAANATQLAQATPATQASPDGDDKTLMMGSATQHEISRAHTEAASITAHGAGLTRVGAIMGTPLYMSPEQCRSARLDARSDIYSLGVIAYQMLAGDPPFMGSMQSVMREHRDTPPTPLRERTRKVPKRAANVIMSALAKDPAKRPQTAAAFASSLSAQAASIGSLYRRAFSLYSEYFPKFLKLSLIVHLPAIIFTVLLVILQIVEPTLIHKGLAVKIATLCAMAFVGLGLVLSYFLSAPAISGLTAVMVTQLAVAPLRPVELRTVFGVLKRRWRPLLNTGLRLTLRIMICYVLGIIPGIVVTLRYALWAPVVLMEGLTKKAALKRARELASRSWRTLIIVCALQVLIPMGVSAMLGRFSVGTPKPAASHGVKVSRSDSTAGQISQELAGLVNILVVPLMSIVPALLYLKMRQLGGETLSTALAQIEEVEGARSEWQRRMRSRLTVTPQAQTPPPTQRSTP